MIHEIGVELQAALAAKGAGFLKVFDGGSPEARPASTFARERIVIEHDPAGDRFGPRHRTDGSPRTLPRTLMTRTIGVKLTLYVKAPAGGSNYWAHKRKAEHALDLVLCALYSIAKGRQNQIDFRSGRFVEIDDLQKSETPGGAAYELLFGMDRGVADRRWDDTTGALLVTISPSMIGAPSVTFSASAHAITRATGSFLDDRFAVGQSIIVSGSTSNNGTFGPITSITSTVMSFATGLANEGPVVNVVITGNGVIIHNSTSVSGDIA